MILEPVAYFRAPLAGKFGLPRQSGVAPSLKGEVVLEPAFRGTEALRGLEGFDYLWLIWGFSLNGTSPEGKTTVRPPRLGGNARVGVFASRSPFRPNPLGLSCVRIERISPDGITVLGADLADGTPIYDIKPYLPYADAFPQARGGYTDSVEWQPLQVEFPEALRSALGEADTAALAEILSQDPRPAFHDDPERVYALEYRGRTVRFRVNGSVVTVLQDQD
jgi:tRNA-Thr(GGU) m(6)t(6)A37 methyltransferase TsaA